MCAPCIDWMHHFNVKWNIHSKLRKLVASKDGKRENRCCSQQQVFSIIHTIHKSLYFNLVFFCSFFSPSLSTFRSQRRLFFLVGRPQFMQFENEFCQYLWRTFVIQITFKLHYTYYLNFSFVSGLFIYQTNIRQYLQRAFCINANFKMQFCEMFENRRLTIGTIK